MNCTAINSGDWNSSNVWQDGNIPGTNDDITINTGVTVNIDNSKMPYQQFGNLVQLGAQGTSGSLTVNGVLNIKVVAVAGPSACNGISIYSNSKVIVNSGGAINISATGYDFGATVNAYGMSCSQKGSITNNGSITIAAHNVTGGIGIGIYLNDDATQFVNSVDGNVTINETSFEKDGRGHCYGFYISDGTLNNAGTIQSNNTSSGVIKTDSTGKVNNTGTIINCGTINNGGTFNNQGTISNVLPSASYKGNNINNQPDGIISLSGVINSPTTLESIVPLSNSASIRVRSNDILTVNTTFTISEGYTLVCLGSLVNNGAITNAGTFIFDLGATYTPKVANGSYLIQGGAFMIQGTSTVGYTLDLNQIINQPNSFTLSNNVFILMSSGLNFGNLALTIPSNLSFTISEGAQLETTQAIVNNGYFEMDGFLVWNYNNQVTSPFTGNTPMGSGYIALQGNISSGFSFSNINWSQFIILANNSLTITQSEFNFSTANDFAIQENASLYLFGRVNVLTSITNGGTIYLKTADIRITSTGNLDSSNGEIIGSGNSIFVLDVAGTYSISKPITGLYQFYIQGNNNSYTCALNNLSDINTQFIIGNPENTPEVVCINSLTIVEGYKLNINTSLNLSHNFSNVNGILRINTLNSYKFSSVVNSGTICIFNTGTIGDIDNDLSNFFPIFTGCTDFQVSNNDHLYIGSDSISGVNLTINGTVTIIPGKTLSIGNPAPGKSTFKILGSFDNTNATVIINNTQGIALHFDGMNPGYNTGELDLSNGPSATINGTVAGLYLERTLLKNYTQTETGTIINNKDMTSIYCNQGTICGGKFDPNITPFGSAFKGQSATYVANCGD